MLPFRGNDVGIDQFPLAVVSGLDVLIPILSGFAYGPFDNAACWRSRTDVQGKKFFNIIEWVRRIKE